MSRFDRVQEIFGRAESLHGDARRRLLDEACGDDRALRADVESLLRARDEVGAFLDAPSKSWVGRRIGAYAIESVLGEGGMGVVFRAQQDQPRRPVALKLVRGAVTSDKARQRFELEAEALGRLDHPAIASIFEAGTFESEGRRHPYFAMEWVDGRPLDRYLAEERPSVRDRVRLFSSVCDGIHHAHLRGVVHRDLKPANVLVRPDGTPKIVDFGVARLVDAEERVTTQRTSGGDLVGTLAYMSPEQVGGGAVDLRSDVYTLGVVMTEALTGVLPYSLQGADFVRAIRVICDEEPVVLARGSSTLDVDLRTILGKCLRKPPEDRYASAAELRDDLQRFLRHQPILARPLSTTYRLRMLARRHRVGVFASAVAVVALVGGLTLSLLGWNQARDQRALARAAADEAEAINGFLTEILAAPDPYFAGRDAKVIDVIDQAAASVDARFAEAPAIGLRIENVLAETYQGLGLRDLAATHRHRAVQRATDLATARDSTVLVEPLLELAQHWMALGRYDAADSVAMRLTGLVAPLPASAWPRYRLTILRAHIVEDRGDPDAALALLEPALQEARRWTDELPEEIVSDLEAEIGNLYWQTGRPEEARDLLRSAGQALRAKLGPDHVATLALHNNLAVVHQELGEFEVSRELLEAILDAKIRTNGATHPSTGVGHHNLANLLRAMGRSSEALAHHEQALAIETAIEPANEVRIAIYRAGFGQSLLEAGQRARGLETLDRALGVLLEAFGSDHPRVRALQEIAAASTDG